MNNGYHTKPPALIMAAFRNLKSARDIAVFFEVEYKRLVYHLYVIDDEKKYCTFTVPKKSGKTREISAPISAIKILQRKLNYVLQMLYKPKGSTHGFVKGRNIKTNARFHANQRFVLKTDLKDFFPSINFGRVRGLFQSYPFHFNDEVSTRLAQLCCHRGQLPQGAPTSPVISNYICARMDSELRRLANQCKCYYTRYADDLTFSTSKKTFPAVIASRKWDKNNECVELGSAVCSIISNNGFEINQEKTDLLCKNERQKVTGLIVNKFPNVGRKYTRKVRAMLHAWKRYGLKDAEDEYYQKYNRKYRFPENRRPTYDRIVAGMISYIGMIRNRNDQENRLYRIYKGRFKKLNDIENYNIQYDKNSDIPFIITEGKTFYKHLRTALTKLKLMGFHTDLEVEFHEFENNISIGDSELYRICKWLCEKNKTRPIICLFDRDNIGIMNKITSEEKLYKLWGKNVFTAIIPIPSHHTSNPEISIEFYYKDVEIKQVNDFGNRLYINKEFDPETGMHRTDPLRCTLTKKIEYPNLTIIDKCVVDSSHRNVALSKEDFANYIMKCVENFNNFDFSEFKKIFDLIVEIKNSEEGSRSFR